MPVEPPQYPEFFTHFWTRTWQCYRHADGLYTLVVDSAFLNGLIVVWERIEDFDRVQLCSLTVPFSVPRLSVVTGQDGPLITSGCNRVTRIMRALQPLAMHIK